MRPRVPAFKAIFRVALASHHISEVGVYSGWFCIDYMNCWITPGNSFRLVFQFSQVPFLISVHFQKRDLY